MHHSAESIEWKNRGVLLVRSPRMRAYKLAVHPNSTIQLKIPMGWKRDQILRTLLEHEVWLEQCLQRAVQLQSRFTPYVMKEGETFLLLGQTYKLKYEKAESDVSEITVRGEDLIFSVPKSSWFPGFEIYPHPQLKKSLLSFYEKKAQLILVPLFWRVVERIGYGPKKLILRNQKTLWGSCSRHNSTIQFNKKLIAAPLSVTEYVMIHELAHLKYANHGLQFWNEVQVHCPTFRHSKCWLAKNHYAFSFFENSQDLFATVL